MKTVVLYGELANRFGKTHKFAVKNVAESIRALQANFKGFSKFMGEAHNYGIGFHIIVGRNSIGDERDVINPCSDSEIIRIVPALFGSGSGLFKVLLGAALVVGGIFLTPVSAGLSSAFISAGAGLIIGGVSQLLTKPPTVDQQQSATQNTSYIFSGPQNTTAQGGPVPIGYGRMMIGSVTISAGIETYETT